MRRTLTATVSVLAAATMVLAACAPPTAEDVEETDTTEEEPTEEDGAADDDADGDETDDADDAASGPLVIARTGDVDSLDPHRATAFQSVQALEQIYETLFEHDEDLNVVGSLVEEWEYSEDGETLQLQLTPDATFHDGSPLTSDDVVASLERVLDEDSGSVARANILSIAAAEADGDHGVTLNLERADATLPAALTSTNTAIAPAAAIESGTIENEPLGSGPFLFDEWSQGDVFRMVRYDDYWRGTPALEGIEIRVVPDEGSVEAGLTAGQYHLGVITDPIVISQIDESELDVQREPALAYRVLQLNTEVAPFDDPMVRQAIACAVDRQELVDSALLGEGEVTGPFTAPAWRTDAYAGLPCDGPDTDLSLELLADAGYEDGFSFEMIVMTGGYETAVNEAQSLQSQLSAIGIEADIQQLETSVYVDRWLATDYEGAVALNGGNPDPHLMYARYFTSDGNLQSVATYSSEELDQLFADGEAETDPAARAAIYAEISERLLEASPWIWTANGFEYRVLRPEVSGFQSLSTGSMKGLRDASLHG